MLLALAVGGPLARSAPASAAAARGDDPVARLEQDLQWWLSGVFESAFVKVRGWQGGNVEVVANLVPRPDSPPIGDAEVDRLVESMRVEVLDRVQPGLDFASGSQFVVLGSGRLEVEGAGEELTRQVRDLAADVVKTATGLGLSVQFLSATAYAGPMVALELETRGVGLGPERQTQLREELLAALTGQVFGSRWRFMTFLEEDSFVEVLDYERPLEASPVPAPAPASPPSEPAPAPPVDPPAPVAVPPEPAPPVPTPEAPPAPEPVRVLPAAVAGTPGRLGEEWKGSVRRRLAAVRRSVEGGDEPAAAPGGSASGLAAGSSSAVAPGEGPDFGLLLREARARRPWEPPLPVAALPVAKARGVPPEYPAAPFARGPGVATCDFMVWFDTDRAEVKDIEKKRLAEAIGRIGAERIRGVTVVGHADTRNTDDYNLKLGKRRADAVRTALSGLGVPADRIKPLSYGETDPLAEPDDTDPKRSLNRRALLEIAFHDPDRRLHTDTLRPIRDEHGIWDPPHHGPDGKPRTSGRGRRARGETE